MKKYRKITNECIETHYRYMNYQYREILISHSPHGLKHDRIVDHKIDHKPIYKIKDISNLTKKLNK